MATLQPGDYLVTKTAGPLLDHEAARLIRWFTAEREHDRWQDADVNHAAVYVGPTPDHPEGAIVEAVKRVRYNSVTAYPDAIWSTGRLPAHLTPDQAQRNQITASAKAMIGLPYNWLDLLAIALAQQRTGRVVTGREWWVRRLSDDRHLICSQLVDTAYHDAGIELFTDGRLPGLVSPADLEHLLAA